MDILQRAVGDKAPCVQEFFNLVGASVDSPDDIGRLVQRPVLCGIPLFELIDLIKKASIEAIPTPQTLELEQFLGTVEITEKQIKTIVDSGIPLDKLSGTDLTQLSGIGQGTANKINDALSSGGF